MKVRFGPPCGLSGGEANLSLWQGGRGMRIMTVAFAETALALCNLTFSGVAHAQPREKRSAQPKIQMSFKLMMAHGTVTLISPMW